MTAPDRLRALLAKPGFVAMPAVWDGLSAKLTAEAGFADRLPLRLLRRRLAAWAGRTST